jgi:hypothetical protein
MKIRAVSILHAIFLLLSGCLGKPHKETTKNPIQLSADQEWLAWKNGEIEEMMDAASSEEHKKILAARYKNEILDFITAHRSRLDDIRVILWNPYPLKDSSCNAVFDGIATFHYSDSLCMNDSAFLIIKSIKPRTSATVSFIVHDVRVLTKPGKESFANLIWMEAVPISVSTKMPYILPEQL